MALKDYVLQEKEYIIEMRRYFHAHPEVSLQEYETCKKIEVELDALGIPHRRVGETGVYAWIDGKKSSDGKVVALRADIDALAMEDLKTVEYHSKREGFCHACGHDAHTATLLGAAKVLKAKENQFSGQVRLFFQQAEEIGQGARLFVGEGLLDGCERVFGTHVSSRLQSGKIALTKGPQCASCDYFKITIKGRGAHVSTPHLGVDAAYIASQVVVNLQSIVARSTAPLETVVVGVGVIKAGTQYNIIAENAEIEGTTRSFLPEVRSFTNERVVQIAKQTAAMYGAQAEVRFLDYAAPLVNDREAVEEVTRIAERLIDSSDIVTDYEKALGADDFADFLAVTKGMYAFIGTGNEENPNTLVAHHHGLFDIDEEALLLSCNLYVDYALQVLES
ncbi:M20 metallopeptidase family protein [Anaerotignum sp. MB30-C6]|uniref:M20 metallopeptidase family protein n=1 Tax=Anaerotignum sp. MB30-C6 TaxID=3070814 RepID=UPI0027DBC087|nr:amidohydrolase [Anaerotignum sp. MB30-C6]WMI80513.1 amidohydrolase [Anaerotignum sp. MB30-C6]